MSSKAKKNEDTAVKTAEDSSLAQVSSAPAASGPSTPAPSVPVPSPAQELQILLMDHSHDWSGGQQELLAVAQHLYGLGYAVHIFCPKGSPLMQKAKNLELPVLNYGGRISLWWHFKRQKPLLMHSFSPESALLAESFSRWRLEGTTLCVHSFAACALQAELASTMPALMQVYTKLHRGVYSSATAKKYWEKQGLNLSHTHTIYSALPAQPWIEGALESPQSSQSQGSQEGKKAKKTLKASYELTHNRCLFVVAAHLYAHGGVNTVLKSMARLLEQEEEQCNTFEVRIVGTGENFESLLTDARGLGVEGRLALLGEQDLAEVLPWAHALILPQEDAEQAEKSFMALLAAYGTALPVLCSDVAPYNELKQGKMLFFAAEDDAALAQHMLTIMKDSALRKTQGAFSAAMRDFALMPRLQQEYARMYVQCLEQKGWGFLSKKECNS